VLPKLDDIYWKVTKCPLEEIWIISPMYSYKPLWQVLEVEINDHASAGAHNPKSRPIFHQGGASRAEQNQQGPC
jgi:hypothetical protein